MSSWRWVHVCCASVHSWCVSRHARTAPALKSWRIAKDAGNSKLRVFRPSRTYRTLSVSASSAAAVFAPGCPPCIFQFVAVVPICAVCCLKQSSNSFAFGGLSALGQSKTRVPSAIVAPTQRAMRVTSPTRMRPGWHVTASYAMGALGSSWMKRFAHGRHRWGSFDDPPEHGPDPHHIQCLALDQVSVDRDPVCPGSGIFC